MGGITFDATEHLYAAVGGGATSGVWIFECADGEPTRIAGTEAIGLPIALAFDDAGNLYVPGSNSDADDDQAALGAVWRIGPDGTIVRGPRTSCSVAPTRSVSDPSERTD